MYKFIDLSLAPVYSKKRLGELCKILFRNTKGKKEIMKLKFTRFSARFVMSCFVIGSMFHTGAYTVGAETNTRVHVYYEETGGNIGTYDSINEALKKADGKQKIVLELLDSEYQEFVTIDKANVTLKSKDTGV